MLLGSTIRKFWPLFLILTLGAILRFWSIESLTTFSGDQGYDYIQVKSILTGNLTLLGPKIGPYNEAGNLYLGPAYYYIIAPALLIFNFDPIGPALLTAIASVLTIVVIYILCLKFYSKVTALIATFLYAVNPFIILQSKAASNPHFLPLFSALAFFFLLITNNKDRTIPLFAFLGGASLSVMFQLHYLSFVLFVVFLLFFLKNRQFKSMLIVLCGFVALNLPQIIFELKHNFFVSRLFINQLNSGNTLINLGQLRAQIIKAVLILTNIVVGEGIIAPFFVILIFIYLLLTNRPRKIKQVNTLVILSIISLCTVVILYSGNVDYHYFASIYPLIFILIAHGISTLVFSKVFLNRFFGWTIFGLLVASSILGITINSKQGYTMPKGWNLKGQKLAASRIINNLNTHETFNIASTLDGDTRNMPIRYLLISQGKIPLDVEKYPESDVIYLISRDDEKTIANYTVWEVSSFRPFRTFNLGEIQNGIYLYKLSK